MGKSVIASVKQSTILSEIDANEGYIPGLIIGQATDKADYVAHLARTPVTLTGSNPVDSPSKLDESWLVDHVKNVSPLLPGGIAVLGIFLVGPSDVLSSDMNSSKMIALVNRIRKLSSTGSYLILAFNSKTKKFACKGVTGDSLTATLSPVEWKFQNKTNDLCIAETYFNLRSIGSIVLPRQENKTVKSFVDGIMDNVRNTILESKSLVNNSFRKGDERLSDIKKELEGEKKKDDESKNTAPFVFKIGLFSTKLNVRQIFNEKPVGKNVDFTLNFSGQLISRAYVHENVTVSETIEYLKKDVIKSLETRLRMYWDSCDDLTIRPSVLQPPKRVMYHDANSGLAFSDYMFVDDTEDDIVCNLEEQLGLTVDTKNLVSFYEVHKCVGEYSNENDGEETSNAKPEKSSSVLSSHAVVLSGIAVATFVLLLALILQFLT